MQKKFFNKLKKAIESFWEGYELLEVITTSEDHVFRGKIRKPTGSVKEDMLIVLRESDKGNILAFVENYSEDEKLTVNLESGKINDKNDKVTVDPTVAEAERKAKLEEFKKNIPKPSKKKLTSEHPLLAKKKIKPYGRAKLLKNKKWVDILDPIGVPFYSSREDHDAKEACGMQVIGLNKEGKSKKTSVPKSTFKGAFHILQDGIEDEIFSSVDGFICESYTTACEVAEAFPDAFVACTAGMSNLRTAYGRLSADKYNLIYVLDKVKSGQNISKIERNIKSDGASFIQLSMTDPSLGEMTDFNDYALRFGKKAAKKEMVLQSQPFLTKIPEVVEYEADTGFKVISSKSQVIETVHNGSLENFFYRMCSDSTTSRLTELLSLEFSQEDGSLLYHSKENFSRYLSQEAKRSKHSIPRGIGIHKDGEGYVLNMNDNDRYMMDKTGKIEYTGRIRPFGREKFINPTLLTGMDDSPNPHILKEPMTKDHFNQIMELCQKSFDLPKSYFSLLLGFLVQGALTSFSLCRPHLWLNGVSNSGKTFIMNEIAAQLLCGTAYMFKDTTKAGLMQDIGQDSHLNAVMTLGDEMAPDNAEKKRILRQLLLMSKDMFTGGVKGASRGTKEQVAKSYYRAFSMIFTSTKHTLEDDQEIGRWLVFDIKNFQLKGGEYKEVGRSFQSLSGVFTRACLQAAPHFISLMENISGRFEEFYSEDNRTIAHKTLSLSSCLAGYAALCKVVFGLDDEGAIQKAVKDCEEGVHYQIKKHKDMVGVAPSLLDDLRQVRFKYGLHDEGSLGQIGFQNKEELWDKFGFKAVKGRKAAHGYYTLYIKRGEFKFDAFLDPSKKHIQSSKRLYNVQGQLEELLDAGKITNGKIANVRCYKIDKFEKTYEEE